MATRKPVATVRNRQSIGGKCLATGGSDSRTRVTGKEQAGNNPRPAETAKQPQVKGEEQASDNRLTVDASNYLRGDIYHPGDNDKVSVVRIGLTRTRLPQVRNV